ELVQHLAHPNSWWRLTAQRLLVERQDRSVVPALEKLAGESKSELGRAHALWTLDGLGALHEQLVLQALGDRSAGVREEALRLAEKRIVQSEESRQAVLQLANDSSARVRFQAAFTLGETDSPPTTRALGQIALRDFADPWIRLAVLSSAAGRAHALLDLLTAQAEFTSQPTADQLQFLTQIARLLGAEVDHAKLAAALKLLTPRANGAVDWQIAVLTGLAQGMQGRQESLSSLFNKPPDDLKGLLNEIKPIFASSASLAVDEKRPLGARLSSIRLLAYGASSDVAETLQNLLKPQNPSEIQVAAVHAFADQNGPKVGEILLAFWE